MGKNPVSAIVASVLIVLCVVWLVYYYVMRPPIINPAQSWWYDMDEKKLYGAPGQPFPPEVAPSGGEAVKAIIYYEKDCADPNDRQIVFLYKFTPEGKEIMLTTTDISVAQETAATQVLVKRENDADWELRSPEERNEMVAAAEEERGVKLRKCLKYEE